MSHPGLLLAGDLGAAQGPAGQPRAQGHWGSRDTPGDPSPGVRGTMDTPGVLTLRLRGPGNPWGPEPQDKGDPDPQGSPWCPWDPAGTRPPRWRYLLDGQPLLVRGGRGLVIRAHHHGVGGPGHGQALSTGHRDGGPWGPRAHAQPRAGGRQSRRLPDTAVGSGDHPVLADQRPATEVEVVVALAGRAAVSSRHCRHCRRGALCPAPAPAPTPAPSPAPSPAAGTHLEGDLPWPGPRHCRLPVDDAVVAADDGRDGGHAAACGAQAAVGRGLWPPRPRDPPPLTPPSPLARPAGPRSPTHSPGRGWHGQSPPAPGSSAATAEPSPLVRTDPAWGSARLIGAAGHSPAAALAAVASGDSVAPGTALLSQCQPWHLGHRPTPGCTGGLAPGTRGDPMPQPGDRLGRALQTKTRVLVGTGLPRHQPWPLMAAVAAEGRALSAGQGRDPAPCSSLGRGRPPLEC